MTTVIFLLGCGIIEMVPLPSSVFDVDIKPIHSHYRKRKKASKDHGMASEPKILLWNGPSVFVNNLGLFHFFHPAQTIGYYNLLKLVFVISQANLIFHSIGWSPFIHSTFLPPLSPLPTIKRVCRGTLRNVLISIGILLICTHSINYSLTRYSSLARSLDRSLVPKQVQ